MFCKNYSKFLFVLFIRHKRNKKFKHIFKFLLINLISIKLINTLKNVNVNFTYFVCIILVNEVQGFPLHFLNVYLTYWYRYMFSIPYDKEYIVLFLNKN